MTNHQQALERVHGHIIEQFGGTDDPVELEKLEGIAGIGMEVAGFLQSEFADEGSWVDSGSDGTVYDCHVTLDGREYCVQISPGSTAAEPDQWEADIKEEASQWDLLCPRVIDALKLADPELAAEFETYVAPRDSDGTR